MTPTYDPNRPEWRAFVKAMRASRVDDTTRLAFADWLEDEYPGQPLQTLIRSMTEAQQITPGNLLKPTGYWTDPHPGIGRPNYRPFCDAVACLRETWRSWPPLDKLSDTELGKLWLFDRGFPTRVVIDWPTWARLGDSLCAIGPVGDVVMTTRPRTRIVDGESQVRFEFGGGLMDRRFKDRVWLVNRYDWMRASPFQQVATLNECTVKFLRQAWPEDAVAGFSFDPEGANRHLLFLPHL